MIVLTIGIFCFLLSSSIASAANIVIDKQTGPAEPGIFHTANYASDAACIQAALDSSKSGDTITICAGDYYITKGIYQKGKNLNITGEGKVTLYIKTSDKEYNELFFCGSVVASKTLSADAVKDSSQVVLNNASQVRQNDLIKIWKNVQWCPLEHPDNYPDQMTGEIYEVKSVDGNTVTLNQPLLRDYRLSEGVQVEIYRPVQIHVKNIRMEDTGASMSHHGVVLQYCRDSSVSDSWLNNSGFGAICLYSCFNVSIHNNEIYNSLLPGSGYGVNVASGTAFVNIENNHIENCRHAITGNSAERKSLNRDVFITNNTLIGANIRGSWVVDAHALTINFVVTGNEIYPQLPYFMAFSDGTQQSIFSNNKIIGGYGGIFKRGAVCDGVHIYENNTFNGMAGEMYRGGTGTDETLIIRNNVQNSGIYGVHFPYKGGFRNILISGNSFSNLSDQAVSQKLLINGVNLNVSDNAFENIKLEGVCIDGNSFKNGEVKVQNNTLINVNKPNYSSGITVKNIQNAEISGNQIFETRTLKVPIAAFSSSAASGNAPLTVEFTDRSTNSPSAWKWNFGDETIDSTLQNPIHTYSTAGNYTVILTAINAAGSNTVTGVVQVEQPQDSDGPAVSELEITDNRLRDASPDTVYQNSPFIDAGGMKNVSYRDIIQFDLSEYASDSRIENATLSLYWYYPAGNTRPNDTVIEVYRPASAWNSSYVSWNKRDKDTSWKNAGGDWYDKNGVLQGNTPYATLTLKGSTLPDNKYYKLNVTDLVKEYVSGKYENTGLLIKARTENNNYVAFYSSDCGNENQVPELKVAKKVPATLNATVIDATDNRLREGSPDAVYQSSTFIDLGGMNSLKYRDLVRFNLDEYTGSAEVSNATLSLYWYYPAGKSRPEDTVIEVYRPASAWNSSYASWNKRNNGVAWTNAGGDWYDKNGVLQGSTPYATITIKSSSLPDNKYYELNVTDLVKEYTSGKYENTGFLIKARNESNNYIAFYSNDWENKNQIPKLQLVYN
jgi:uncharacterized membrane protein